ncbi:MAG: hypothetical protein ACLTA1_01000 [Clostridia bacterium]
MRMDLQSLADELELTRPVFSEQAVVVARALLRIERQRQEIQERSSCSMSRGGVQPLEQPSAEVFKRPPGHFAGI